ncbi:MAG: Type 1 glutamine amidotransferase-like domain-containing protein [Vulcanimicrobiaceae bacterium]
MSVRRIVAIGGGALQPELENFALERYVLDACGAARPRLLFVATASGEQPDLIARFAESYGALGAELRVLRFFRRTLADLRAEALEADAIHVGGGNTRSMLAVWREWGFDAILREAWERGVLLCGSSAGSICWFESGLTDSVAGTLGPLAALGFLTGSHCPHYDGEPERRPRYRELVGCGALPAGYACDDGAALVFENDALAEVVAAKPNARAYRVERDGAAARESALDVRRLAPVPGTRPAVHRSRIV